MSNPFFSIIIPVYNGLTHDLPICLESIWLQPLDPSQYEVICVDDCSTDDTRRWLDEEAAKHSNMRVIKHSVNKRQGGGRNTGVRAANGKYILFIDQDDYYHQGALRKIYDCLSVNKSIEVFVSDSAFQFKGHESNTLQLNLPFREIADSVEFVKKNGIVLAPWRLCILRSFYLEHHFEFPEFCRIEDVDWACRVLYYTKRMTYQPILLVHYNKAETGQTDNMYRNVEILRANTMAGRRTWDIAKTLYENNPLQQTIFNVAEMYFNFTCRYMFGMFTSIQVKQNIIKLIPTQKSRFKLVNMAMYHTIFFCIVSNLGVPLFRVLRLIIRWRKARQLSD